ncbi:alginate lyase [Psychromonas sp. RZ5]|nr:alginate lyase [Psychromonas sp. RZ5]
MVDHDISYWAALYSYFKAGVYNQYTNGNSVVRFKTLTYSDGLLISELDSSLAPSANFDLSKWNLSVPIDNGEGDGYKKATTVTVEDLNDDYQLADYFWTDTSDGGMVFKDYIDGAITSKNTTYTRTELREMLRGTDTSISTQGVNGNNWVFSSVPTDLQNKAGGVDGNMVATLAVNHVTTTGKDSYVGRVIIGQIHAASDEPIRIYYRLLPGHTKGSVYFAHEPSNGNDEQWYEMIGSRDDDADEPSDGIELDEKFSYEIDVVGDIMTVTITREDGSTIEEEVDMSNSGYSDGYYTKDGVETEDYMYFKAGVYNQNKLVDEDEDGNDDYGAEADDYVQATFYYLTVSH